MNLFLSREGYFKKITPQSLRMSGEQKYKEGDGPAAEFEATNRSELLIFTDRCQVYKTSCADFEDCKASLLGDYLPTKLGMDEGENVFALVLPGEYEGNILFVYENGKVAKVSLETYQTKTNRRKLTGAYADRSPLKAIIPLPDGDEQVVLYSNEGRALIFNSAQLAVKATRTCQGVAVMTLRRKHLLSRAELLGDSSIKNVSRYRTRTLPVIGALLKEEDTGEEQIELPL